MSDMKVVEGVAGTWHYHLREADHGPALCGAFVMRTQIPFGYWNRTPKNYHLPEKWCKNCAEKAGISK